LISILVCKLGGIRRHGVNIREECELIKGWGGDENPRTE
jgi:hypothetical protein